MEYDPELYEEILWVMTYYGSDAQEREKPGSKLRSQAARICQFVHERAEAQVRCQDLSLIKIVRSA